MDPDTDASFSEEADVDPLLFDDDVNFSLEVYLADLTSTMDESTSSEHDPGPRSPAALVSIKCKAGGNSSKKGMPWTPEEEAHIRDLQTRYGNDWFKISQGVPGRSELSCRSRWYSHILSPTKTIQRRKEGETHLKKKTVRVLEIDPICKEQVDMLMDSSSNTAPSNTAFLTTFPYCAMMPFAKFSFSDTRPHPSKRSNS